MYVLFKHFSSVIAIFQNFVYGDKSTLCRLKMGKALHLPEDNDISVSNVTALELYIQIEFQQNLYVAF